MEFRWLLAVVGSGLRAEVRWLRAEFRRLLALAGSSLHLEVCRLCAKVRGLRVEVRRLSNLAGVGTARRSEVAHPALRACWIRLAVSPTI
ncbi:hypothetical protein GCM10023148_37110 [Actinokineospora soli]